MMVFDGLRFSGPILLIPLEDFIGGPSRLAAFDTLTCILSVVGIVNMIFCLFVTPRYRTMKDETAI
jgi:Na+/melibiose symporter-like transporter